SQVDASVKVRGVLVFSGFEGLSMDLNQIEHFLRVAELGSINRAAKELGLSQPALSRSLSQLEQDLGQQLVVRCRNRHHDHGSGLDSGLARAGAPARSWRHP